MSSVYKRRLIKRKRKKKKPKCEEKSTILKFPTRQRCSRFEKSILINKYKTLFCQIMPKILTIQGYICKNKKKYEKKFQIKKTTLHDFYVFPSYFSLQIQALKNKKSDI